MPAAAAAPIHQWMSALADTTRTRALRLLQQHELTVAELCSVLQLPQSTVSRHLKVLADERWVDSRRDGTSRLYRLALDTLDPAARRLWTLIKEQTENANHSSGGANGSKRPRKTNARDPKPGLRGAANSWGGDDRRLARVLARRQTRSQAFFASAAGQWDKLRAELFGDRFDLWALITLLDRDWIVGDLGCGTGQLSEALAPFVRHVIAVDASAPMLTAARKRLRHTTNTETRKGQL
ncbi:MAG: hypothetical protein CMJ49_07540, partial [Planctomycetaceae bacterium]|nr:hypothetical protein [Planctomycetaceae bacterium]